MQNAPGSRWRRYWHEFFHDLSRLWPQEEPKPTPAPPVPNHSQEEADYPPKDHLDALLQLVAAGMEGQGDEFERIERKATTILATTGVLAGLAVNGAARLARGSIATVLLGVGLVVLLYGVVCGILVIWPESTKGANDPERLLVTGYNPPTSRLLAGAVSAIAEAARLNRVGGLVRRRNRWLRRQLRALVLGVLFLLLAYLASSIPLINDTGTNSASMATPVPSTTATATRSPSPAPRSGP